MPDDRFDDLDISGDDTIGTPAGVNKVIHELTVEEVARWLFKNKIQSIRIAPRVTKDGKLDLGAVMSRFPNYWKPQQ